MRDRLVCQVNDKRIQRIPLRETDLIFKKALELAQAIESIDKDMLQLRTSQDTSSLLYNCSTPSKIISSKQLVCTRRKSNHMAPNCHFKEAECGMYNRKGHLARMCQSKPQRPTLKNSLTALRLDSKTHYVEEDDELTDDSSYSIF